MSSPWLPSLAKTFIFQKLQEVTGGSANLALGLSQTDELVSKANLVVTLDRSDPAHLRFVLRKEKKAKSIINAHSGLQGVLGGSP